MASGWAQPLPPISGVQAAPPKRQWCPMPPDNFAGDTPPPTAALAPKVKAMDWAPKHGPPRQGPNPLRRLPARQEPEGWKQPKAKLAFGGKENAEPTRSEAKRKSALYGWGVSAPGGPPAGAKAKGKGNTAGGAKATAQRAKGGAAGAKAGAGRVGGGAVGGRGRNKQSAPAGSAAEHGNSVAADDTLEC